MFIHTQLQNRQMKHESVSGIRPCYVPYLVSHWTRVLERPVAGQIVAMKFSVLYAA